MMAALHSLRQRQPGKDDGAEQPAGGGKAEVVGADAAVEVVAGQVVGPGHPLRVNIDARFAGLAEGRGADKDGEQVELA